MFILSNRHKFPDNKIGLIQWQLEKIEDKKFLAVQSANYKNPATLLLISFLLGWLGVDRFMLGHIVAGILKLLTFGGFGLWWFIDLLLIMQAIKEQNFVIFTRIAI